MITDGTELLILATFLLTGMGFFFIGRIWGRVIEYQRWRRIWRAYHGEDSLTMEVYPILPPPDTPWSCDVCGRPGVKSVGPEGYCHKHRYPEKQ